MLRQLSVAALTFAMVAPPPGALAAQEPVREVLPGDAPDRIMQFVMTRRARLGLKVNLRARDTDSIGAYVDAVTPNGPASKAGIRTGDLITAVDGKSVLAGRQTDVDGGRESLPGLRLIELAAELEPDDTIAVELRRGKERKTVSVVTTDEPTVMFRGRPNGREFAFRYRPDGSGRLPIPFDGADFPFLYGSPLAELELAPLNPDLGQYFGATTGVLVIHVPKESQLALKGGDVVLTIDGRKPESPSHLLRILRSYEDGESFKLEVLRNRKRVTVTGQVGGRGENQ